jgi:hypothetical protein
MSIQFKVYKWDNKEDYWELKTTTSGYSYHSFFNLFGGGDVVFWRVDTYDTETDLTTRGDTWAFWIAPPPFEPPVLTGYNATLAWEVGVTEQWIPDGWTPSGTLLTPVTGKEWQFVDGSWQWSDLQNFVGGGRFQNIVAAFAHNRILIESF